MRYLVIFILIPFVTLSQTTYKLSIYFDNDSSFIKEKYVLKIDSIKQIHKKDSLLISIKGYANNYGLKTYNLKLSERRVKAVKGIISRFTVSNFEDLGSIHLYQAQSRRVDIVFIIPEYNVPDSTAIKKETAKQVNKRKSLSSRKLDITSYSDLELYEVISNIRFRSGTDKIQISSKTALINLADFLRRYPTRHVLPTRHMCCSNDRDPSIDIYNRSNGSNTLSLDRAKAVYDYLIKHGISEDRLQYEGKVYLEPLDWKEYKNKRGG